MAKQRKDFNQQLQQAKPPRVDEVAMQKQKAAEQEVAGRHKNDTGGNERKRQTVHLNDAISRPIQTRIDAKDAYQGRWHKKDCAIGSHAVPGYAAAVAAVRSSVSEMPNSGKNHRNVVLICRRDHFVIAQAASGLDHT
mgnify:CR=1 FL=1